MRYFTQDELHELHTAAVEAGLFEKRTALLAGISPFWVASLPKLPDDLSQLLVDLNRLNEAELADGSVPFDTWLRNAAQITMHLAQGAVFLVKQIALRAGAGGKLRKAPIPDADVVPEAGKTLEMPERVLFADNRLPYTWLIGGVHTGESVLKMEVPVFDRGAPVKQLGAPKLGFGTGWVIAPRVVITCRHVIEAREYALPCADEDDVRLQALGTRMLAGYDHANAAPTTFHVSKLLFEDRALDVALLEIKETEHVPRPLTLRRRPVTLKAKESLAVNIIQHPGGKPKLLGFRNNLLASAEALVLRYYTDTDAGTSGAPLCDDAWNVIGIHRATELTVHTKLRGVSSTYINTGHQIAKVIEGLRKDEALWKRIGQHLRFDEPRPSAAT